MFKSIFIATILLSTSGCLYTDVKFPLDQDIWETKLGTKTGESSNHTILWLVSWGDAGTKKAAENGNITTISHLDMGVQSYVFGAYTRTYTIAYGE